MLFNNQTAGQAQKIVYYDTHITWNVGGYCNFRCPYCYNPPESRSASYLNNDANTDRLIRAFSKLGKCLFISITGGEPFLYPNFIELCKRFTEKHYISINTNLSSDLIYDFCKAIDPVRIINFNCSLHFPERARLILEKDFIKKFNLLKKHKFPVTAHQIMWPPVFSTFDKLYDYFKKDGIFIKPRDFAGIYKEKVYPQSYTEKEVEMMKYYSRDAYQNLTNERLKGRLTEEPKSVCRYIVSNGLVGRPAKIGRYNFKGPLSFKGLSCFAGMISLMIKPNGDIFRCFSDYKPLGNIFEGCINIFRKAAKCEAKICKCRQEGLHYAQGSPEMLSLL